MPSREEVRAKLRERNFTYKSQHDRVEKWKCGTTFVMVPRRDHIDEDWVRSTFRQIGLTPEEIESFLRTCKA